MIGLEFDALWEALARVGVVTGEGIEVDRTTRGTVIRVPQSEAAASAGNLTEVAFFQTLEAVTKNSVGACARIMVANEHVGSGPFFQNPPTAIKVWPGSVSVWGFGDDYPAGKVFLAVWVRINGGQFTITDPDGASRVDFAPANLNGEDGYAWIDAHWSPSAPTPPPPPPPPPPAAPTISLGARTPASAAGQSGHYNCNQTLTLTVSTTGVFGVANSYINLVAGPADGSLGGHSVPPELVGQIILSIPGANLTSGTVDIPIDLAALHTPPAAGSGAEGYSHLLPVTIYASNGGGVASDGLTFLCRLTTPLI